MDWWQHVQKVCSSAGHGDGTAAGDCCPRSGNLGHPQQPHAWSHLGHAQRPGQALPTFRVKMTLGCTCMLAAGGCLQIALALLCLTVCAREGTEKGTFVAGLGL